MSATAPRLHPAGPCLALCLAFTAPALAQEGCPAALAADLQREAPACELMSQGELRSGLGNSNVAYRLYRWVPTLEDTPSILFDSPPYYNTAITLSRAGNPGQAPFWSSYYWQGVAWFETPYFARHAKYGEFLVVPGRVAGTGSFIDDRVLMPTMGRGWVAVRAAPFDPETGDGWLAGLTAHLPPGHGIWKGIRVDYATLTGTTAVWRDGDANCCPSGGEVWFRLWIAGPEIGFEVAEARYTPPPE